MNFNDYKYERVNIDTTKEQFGSLIGKFTNASNVEEQCKYMDEIIKLRNHVETMSTLVSVRHSIDTVDEFYDKENDYYDENGPVLQSFVMDFYKA